MRATSDAVPSTQLTFASRDEHRTWLESQAGLPLGFRVGTSSFQFTPAEVPKPARMTLTLIALDQPSADFGAVFTRNAFPGAPVLVGRQRLAEPEIRAVIVNNKISNVCAPNGEKNAVRVCDAVARELGCSPDQVVPSSTGVIGWTLPVEAMVGAVPVCVSNLSPASVLPAADGIMTTDLYAKVRRRTVGRGSIVGIAKGAGMIEPNMATMLVYLLTDVAVPRERLRAALSRAVHTSFNRISVDSDTSTSDTVALLSSGLADAGGAGEFEAALEEVCSSLAGDVVRNGEGVHHVMRVHVHGAPDEAVAHGLGKAIVNAPLFKCAVAGNDPNVGRLVQAIGKYLGNLPSGMEVDRMAIRLGGVEIFARGVFQLDPEKERRLVGHLKEAELYASAEPVDGVFSPPIDFPPHERCVEIDVGLDAGNGSATVLGADLTHEYVSENADYRS